MELKILAKFLSFLKKAQKVKKVWKTQSMTFENLKSQKYQRNQVKRNKEFLNLKNNWKISKNMMKYILNLRMITILNTSMIFQKKMGNQNSQIWKQSINIKNKNQKMREMISELRLKRKIKTNNRKQKSLWLIAKGSKNWKGNPPN